MIAGIKLVFSLFIYELLVASTFRLIKFFFYIQILLNLTADITLLELDPAWGSGTEAL